MACCTLRPPGRFLTESSMIDNRIYASRRQRLMGELGDGIAILPTAPELVRNGDAHYAYRFDSSFYYLTGFAEPEAVLVLDATAGKSVLFCRDKDIEREIWNGYRFGPEGAKETFGFDEAYSISEFDERLPDLLADRHTLHMGFGRDAAFDARVNVALNALRARFRTGVTAPTVLRDVQALAVEPRALAALGGEHLVVIGIVDHGVRHDAVDRQCDGDGAVVQAADKVHRAVDGVEHPHRNAGGRPRRTAFLLAQDRVIRPQYRQTLPQQPLRPQTKPPPPSRKLPQTPSLRRPNKRDRFLCRSFLSTALSLRG